MLTKREIKHVHSLALKKHRDTEHCFVAEGHRAVDDLLSYCPCTFLAATSSYLSSRQPHAQVVHEISKKQLQALSLQKSPQDVIAIFQKPTHPSFTQVSDLTLALDCIQDPGNLGTIIRMADWMGIRHILCSQTTVDAYSPKVVQSTMGSLSRVALHYVDLPQLLSTLTCPIYGTFLEGEILYQQPLHPRSIVVMGNEGNGISSQVAPYVTHKIFIPSFASLGQCVESLNVATAASIVCAEIRRQEHY